MPEPTFRDGYSPGGLTSKAAHRARSRRGGIRSGQVRRELGHARRRPQIRQVTREEFEDRYRAMCDAEGVPFDRRGLNSTWTLYVAQITAYRVQGNGYETTNQQAAAAMSARGRSRCRRTVQRLRHRLTRMDLISYRHVRRSGALCTPGQMDSLQVRCLHPRRRGANVTPPSGSPTGLTGRSVGEKPSARFGPPKAAEQEPPPMAADPSPTEVDQPDRPGNAGGGEGSLGEGELATLRAALAYVDRRLERGAAPWLLERRAVLVSQLAEAEGALSG